MFEKNPTLAAAFAAIHSVIDGMEDRSLQHVLRGEVTDVESRLSMAASLGAIAPEPVEAPQE